MTTLMMSTAIESCHADDSVNIESTRKNSLVSVEHNTHSPNRMLNHQSTLGKRFQQAFQVLNEEDGEDNVQSS
jgi:hypothetical protein